jgi:hypothetical protein
MPQGAAGRNSSRLALPQSAFPPICLGFGAVDPPAWGGHVGGGEQYGTGDPSARPAARGPPRAPGRAYFPVKVTVSVASILPALSRLK